MVFVATCDAGKLGLGTAMLCRHLPTAPCQLVVQLAAKLAPALVEDGSIQAGLLFHLLTVGFGVAFAGLGPIPYLQIFDTYNRVVLADCCRSLVQVILAGIADFDVNLCNFGFRLFPVLAEGVDSVSAAAGVF